jgi:hypothetical protein
LQIIHNFQNNLYNYNKNVVSLQQSPEINIHYGIHMPPPPPDGRGFDPASEDDMEDNGMSRYMENNDEEGWD